jgi:hypothetical protein
VRRRLGVRLFWDHLLDWGVWAQLYKKGLEQVAWVGFSEE